MRFKWIIVLICIGFFLTVSAVSAGSIDTNDTNVSTRGDVVFVAMENDFELMNDAEHGNYSDLRDEINAGGNNITLSKSTYSYVGGDGGTIEIANSSVIDGRGAVIDMAGLDIRTFNVIVSGVIIKNLTIKNANYDGDGGAVYFSSSGDVKNCNFVNNSARWGGGAICFSDVISIGTVTNCNFVNNSAGGDGGAIHLSVFSSLGNVTNCKFVNNSARGGGGAIDMHSDAVVGCSFINNTAQYGGAIVGYGTVAKCNFTNNKALGYLSQSGCGGAINGECTAVSCNFINNYAEDYASAMYGGYAVNCIGQNLEDFYEVEDLKLHFDVTDKVCPYNSSSFAANILNQKKWFSKVY